MYHATVAALARTKLKVIATLAALTLACAAAAQEPVKVGGTGAALGTMRILGDAYSRANPTFKLEVVPNLGSSGGLKALERDALHFAVISRPLSLEESARGFLAFEYGRTPFVLATSREDIKNLTLEEIANIYAGKTAAWPDGTPIRIVLRPPQDVDTKHLGSFSPRVKEALASAMSRPGMVTGITDQDSAKHLARLRGSLGTSSLAIMLAEKHPIHAVAIEGVAPSVTALAQGTYPYHKTLFLVARDKTPAAAARFMAFVRSPEGQRILSDIGHWIAEPQGNATAQATP